MAKVYDSPTTNLFALLAEEAETNQARKAKTTANKGKEQELTPKERAEAKAIQDAERKAKREAEKAKQEAEAARRKANIEAIGDESGFALQRHQRQKQVIEQKRAPVVAESSPKTKNDKPNKGKGEKSFHKGPKSDFEKSNDKFDKGDLSAAGKPEGKGNKGEGKVFNNNNKQGGDRPQRGREFDKHSQGVAGRKFNPKKGGSGKNNWDVNSPAGTVGTTAEEATHSPALAAQDKETDAEEVTEATPAVEGETTPEDAVADEEKKEEDNSKTWEEYEAEQAAKKKELEALMGVAVAQPRALSDEETKALAKFTLVENTKAAQTSAKNAAVPVKKEKKQPIVIEIAQPASYRPAGRGDREYRNDRKPQRGGRGGDRNDNPQKKGGRVAKAPRVIPSQFPDLGQKAK